MKRLIAVLAVFAVVAGAAFAQDEGSWSVGGNANIQTRIDFKPLVNEEASPANHAKVSGLHWDGGTNEVRGSFELRYRKGGLTTGLNFNQTDRINAVLSFNGENYQFNVEQNVQNLFNANNQGDRGQLWGRYNFQVLNGIALEAAVARDTQQWNNTDYFGDTYTHQSKTNADGSYLLVDVSPMEGLTMGFKVPRIFRVKDGEYGVDLLTESLQKTAFGVRYGSGPLTIATQFALNGKEVNDEIKTNTYFSLSYRINDQMNAGLEYRGEFGKVTAGEHDPKNMFGARFSFADGPLGATLTLKFEDPAAKADDDEFIDINPEIRYDLVDGYLRFTLPVELRIPLKDEGKLTYRFAPTLNYNFLGTGAGGDWVGIRVRYVVKATDGASRPNTHEDNNLQISFRFSF